jgi:hypothetical protein
MDRQGRTADSVIRELASEAHGVVTRSELLNARTHAGVVGVVVPIAVQRDKDRLREREARMRGDEFRRYTAKDVFEDSAFMLAVLSGLLDCPELRAV